MQRTQKELRKTIGEGWSASTAYLSACGITGTLVAEIGNRIANVLNEDRSATRRQEEAEKVWRVTSCLAESMSAFDGATGASFTYAREAAEHLGRVTIALVELQKQLNESAAA